MSFDEKRIKRIADLARLSSNKENRSWTATAIFDLLDESIIGNQKYKKALASCLSGFISAEKIRNHLLVFGPSGTGKTYMIEQVLPKFDIPYIVIDGSSLVPAAYEGNTLSKSLSEFYSSSARAVERGIVVLDEFDKISEKANGGDIHKSHSIQSELLTCIQGKKEGAIDTRNTLWIFLGAFMYTDEMRGQSPRIVKGDLLKYGFKNELLGRITRDTITDIPTVEEVVKRVVHHPAFLQFTRDLMLEGFLEPEFTDEAILKLAKAAQDVRYGMRVVPSILGLIKDDLIFDRGIDRKAELLIDESFVSKIIKENL